MVKKSIMGRLTLSHLTRVWIDFPLFTSCVTLNLNFLIHKIFVIRTRNLLNNSWHVVVVHLMVTILTCRLCVPWLCFYVYTFKLFHNIFRFLHILSSCSEISVHWFLLFIIEHDQFLISYVICKHFLPFCGLSLHFLDGVFRAQKFLILMKWHVYYLNLTAGEGLWGCLCQLLSLVWFREEGPSSRSCAKQAKTAVQVSWLPFWCIFSFPLTVSEGGELRLCV